MEPVAQAPVPTQPQPAASSGSCWRAGAESRLADLMLQLHQQSLQAQEVSRTRQSALLSSQVGIMRQLASSTRWDGIRSLAFGTLSGVASCAAPFAADRFQDTLKAVGSAVLPQIGRCWDGFAESNKMPLQLERSHLDHSLQLAQSWQQNLQRQEQSIQELLRSSTIQVRA